jgi:hypothetical protein
VGGSPKDVAVRNTLILSDDPVAADTRAAALFGLSAGDVGAIGLAERWGLGTTDVQALEPRRVTL